MGWTQDVTIGDLHYLRSKFAVEQGCDGIWLSSFNEATEAFYRTKQFSVSGGSFITWAYLSPEMEINYLSGEFDWINSITEGALWLIEAYLSDGVWDARASLKHFANDTHAYLKRGYGYKKIRLI